MSQMLASLIILVASFGGYVLVTNSGTSMPGFEIANQSLPQLAFIGLGALSVVNFVRGLIKLARQAA